jgi:hypothetical protein
MPGTFPDSVCRPHSSPSQEYLKHDLDDPYQTALALAWFFKYNAQDVENDVSLRVLPGFSGQLNSRKGETYESSRYGRW